MNPPDWLVSAAVSIVVGGTSAWIAGVFAVRRAVQRLKSERAVERRLDWFEGFVYELGRYLGKLHMVVSAHEDELPPADVTEFMEMAQAHMDQLADLSAGARLFASSRTVDLIQEMADEFVGVGDGMIATRNESGDLGWAIPLSRLRDHIRRVSAVQWALVDEHRAELELEALEAAPPELPGDTDSDKPALK